MRRLKAWFKEYFVPHEGNDHSPRVFRSEAAVFLAIFLAVLEGLYLLQVFFILPQSGLYAVVLPNVLTVQTNAERTADGLTVLQVSPLLQAAAQEKANDMASKGYFAHVSPDGKTPWYWFAQVGYAFTYAGENLAVNFNDSSDVTQAWMNSPEHRANILDSHFTQIGIATAQGNFGGAPATYVVELFGAPAFLPAVAAGPSQVQAPRGAPGVAPSAAPLLKESPVVIDQSATTTPAGSETYVAVKGAAVAEPVPAAQAPAGVNIVQAAVASPNTAFNYLLYGLGAAVLLAFILNIVIDIRIQRPNIVMNGLLLLLLIAFVFVFNHAVVSSAVMVL